MQNLPNYADLENIKFSTSSRLMGCREFSTNLQDYLRTLAIYYSRESGAAVHCYFDPGSSIFSFTGELADNELLCYSFKLSHIFKVYLEQHNTCALVQPTEFVVPKNSRA